MTTIEFERKLSEMSDDELLSKTEDMIWLSAYAANNLRSDYHWMVKSCYNECVKGIYERAYEQARNSLR